MVSGRSSPIINTLKPNDGGMQGHLHKDASSAANGQCRKRHRLKNNTQRFAYKVQYSVNKRLMQGRKRGCLVDRGANGPIIGSDMTVLDRTDQFIDLTGIQEHTVRELNLVHAACVARCHLGDVILHVYQGAYMPDKNPSSLRFPLRLMVEMLSTRQSLPTMGRNHMFNPTMDTVSPFQCAMDECT